MFDIMDPFYQDICTPYQYLNQTDIILSDRINYIYNNKDSQCQPSCQFSSYLSKSLYLNCTCEVYIEEKVNNKFSGKKVYESFYDVLKYSNYKIMKCYKLVLNMTSLTKNLGSIFIINNLSLLFVLKFKKIRSITKLQYIIFDLFIMFDYLYDKRNRTFK